MRRAAGAAAVFILLNSLAGLAGHATSAASVPSGAAILVAVAFTGAVLGAWLAVKKLAPLALRRVHTLVLLVSGAKLLFDAVGF